mmetsp:Transcript_3422/g.10325  ORF Transcript_3422/g.10325 Transcript_3422/m.10325 type:complete len:372 (-) Transcript_3422:241-1356(-)
MLFNAKSSVGISALQLVCPPSAACTTMGCTYLATSAASAAAFRISSHRSHGRLAASEICRARDASMGPQTWRPPMNTWMQSLTSFGKCSVSGDGAPRMHPSTTSGNVTPPDISGESWKPPPHAWLRLRATTISHARSCALRICCIVTSSARWDARFSQCLNSCKELSPVDEVNRRRVMWSSRSSAACSNVDIHLLKAGLGAGVVVVAKDGPLLNNGDSTTGPWSSRGISPLRRAPTATPENSALRGGGCDAACSRSETSVPVECHGPACAEDALRWRPSSEDSWTGWLAALLLPRLSPRPLRGVSGCGSTCAPADATAGAGCPASGGSDPLGKLLDLPGGGVSVPGGVSEPTGGRPSAAAPNPAAARSRLL